ncbi:hypothetical protein [Synechococcus sp. CC9616]|uniref:hypothetical protein n=1 Tax=Synechococcus sp. CC9616 TaxID=110663 RepID=UPI0012EB0A17|nr:hypothetical protein [Synechococcus sp. CC9616]
MSESFELTLDEKTKVYLEHTYKSIGGTILEFGSGGSTLLALQSNPNNRVYCCETDSAWLARLLLNINNLGLMNRIVPVHLDVGLTKEWGYPDTDLEGIGVVRMQKFVRCMLKPWHILRGRGECPKFVFIDGRWRAACFLVALLYCQKSMQVLWDDYADREYYDVFSDLIIPDEMIGRSALFNVDPSKFDACDIIDKYVHLFSDWR